MRLVSAARARADLTGEFKRLAGTGLLDLRTIRCIHRSGTVLSPVRAGEAYQAFSAGRIRKQRKFGIKLLRHDNVIS